MRAARAQVDHRKVDHSGHLLLLEPFSSRPAPHAGPVDLGPGLDLLGGLQNDRSLEGSRIALSCACHDVPRDGTANSDQFNIPRGPVSLEAVHIRPAWTSFMSQHMSIIGGIPDVLSIMRS